MNSVAKNIFRTLLPKKVKQHCILGGRLRGKYIVTSWFDYPAAILGYTERALLDWFTQNVKYDETWLDVGAHYGFTSIALSGLVGHTGRVFAFEPMLTTVGYLNQTRQANNFQQMMIIPFALGEGNQLTSKQLPTIRGMVDSTVNHTEWNETFLETSLDWFWPHICGGQTQIDGIKIDVQGMELDTLQGMVKLLHKHRPRLVVEFHAGVDRDKLLGLLENVGYSQLAEPIEPVAGEMKPQYLDNRSYAFLPSV